MVERSEKGKDMEFFKVCFLEFSFWKLVCFFFIFVIFLRGYLFFVGFNIKINL